MNSPGHLTDGWRGRLWGRMATEGADAIIVLFHLYQKPAVAVMERGRERRTHARVAHPNTSQGTRDASLQGPRVNTLTARSRASAGKGRSNTWRRYLIWFAPTFPARRGRFQRATPWKVLAEGGHLVKASPREHFSRSTRHRRC